MTRTWLVTQHLLYTLLVICIMMFFFSVFMGFADLCGQALNDKEILMSEVWRTMILAFRRGIISGGPVVLLVSLYLLSGRIKYQNNA